jgi:hypothetical protein
MSMTAERIEGEVDRVERDVSRGNTTTFIRLTWQKRLYRIEWDSEETRAELALTREGDRVSFEVFPEVPYCGNFRNESLG